MRVEVRFRIENERLAVLRGRLQVAWVLILPNTQSGSERRAGPKAIGKWRSSEGKTATLVRYGI